MIEPLKLTQKQKDKLLEMCRKLFPEYNDKIFIDDDGGFVTDFHLSEQNTYTQTINIHWFEFCMTHLTDAIYYPKGKIDRNTRIEVEYFMFTSFVDTIEGETSGYDHPIDYLYKEFLKLKDDTKIA